MSDPVTISGFEIPVIQETALSKSLVFTDLDIQSRMSLARPDELQFEYTRLMMAALLFNPQPQRVLMVGLGGGSLVKFCYKHLASTHITAVEINPHVIALRQNFHIPEDGARLTVVHADAADFVAATPQNFDVIFIDGFDRQGLPEPLCSAKFYSDCRALLTSGGLIVANLPRYSAFLQIYIDRIESVFEASPVVVQAPGTTNCVVFATRDPGLSQSLSFSKTQPAYLSQEAWQQVLPSMGRAYLAVQTILTQQSIGRAR
jgi:spermidine synthase